MYCLIILITTEPSFCFSSEIMRYCILFLSNFSLYFATSSSTIFAASYVQYFHLTKNAKSDTGKLLVYVSLFYHPVLCVLLTQLFILQFYHFKRSFVSVFNLITLFSSLFLFFHTRLLCILLREILLSVCSHPNRLHMQYSVCCSNTSTHVYKRIDIASCVAFTKFYNLYS